MSFYCKVCECSKHVQTRKHGIACGDIAVEEVEKKQSWTCKGQEGLALDMFRGDNATCNGCLAHREKLGRE